MLNQNANQKLTAILFCFSPPTLVRTTVGQRDSSRLPPHTVTRYNGEQDLPCQVGVPAKTDAFADKHIAGTCRSTHSNGPSRLKGAVNQRQTAEAAASVRTPENRWKNQQKSATTMTEGCGQQKKILSA